VRKKLISFILVFLMFQIVMVGYDIRFIKNFDTIATSQNGESNKLKTPKYIFLFIGDGMSYPQIQLTNYFLNAQENKKTFLDSKNRLKMMDFNISAAAQTYNSTSFIPDSASTATSIASGKKTRSGSINVSEDLSEKYETIAEKLKKQKDYKIGIITSANINHATAAAFYAHQPSRKNYYDIGTEMIKSNFDYFAGGGLKDLKGDNNDKEDLYKLSKKAGYKVVKTKKKVENLTSNDGKVIIIPESLADSDSMNYSLDCKEGEWELADYLQKGIDLLDNDKGFFIMTEGGKIDWACHANDAATTIRDTIALDNAVSKAVDFYNKHQDETLIIVTGDHETGGLTIGYSKTNYDTFLSNFNKQKISYAKFNSDYISKYKKEKTSLEQVMNDVETLFGLKIPKVKENSEGIMKDSADLHPEYSKDSTLVLTNYEYDKIKKAYDETMTRTGEEMEYSEEEYEMYGSYEPLTVTITHILNNKCGVNFSSYAHTALPVSVLVKGVGEDSFNGYYDNTEIYNRLAKLVRVN